MVFTTISDLVEMHNAKRVRILATSGKERSPFVPDVPTFREAGYDIGATSWYGAFAPAKTPPDRSIASARSWRPPFGRRGQRAPACLGLNPTGTSAAELAAIQKADSARWAPAVQASGFTPEQ